MLMGNNWKHNIGLKWHLIDHTFRKRLQIIYYVNMLLLEKC